MTWIIITIITIIIIIILIGKLLKPVTLSNFVAKLSKRSKLSELREIKSHAFKTLSTLIKTFASFEAFESRSNLSLNIQYRFQRGEQQRCGRGLSLSTSHDFQPGPEKLQLLARAMNRAEGLTNFRQFPAARYISLGLSLAEYASDAYIAHRCALPSAVTSSRKIKWRWRKRFILRSSHLARLNFVARYLSLSLSLSLLYASPEYRVYHVIPWNCIPASALLCPSFFSPRGHFDYERRPAVLFFLATQHDRESAEIGK